MKTFERRLAAIEQAMVPLAEVANREALGHQLEQILYIIVAVHLGKAGPQDHPLDAMARGLGVPFATVKENLGSDEFIRLIREALDRLLVERGGRLIGPDGRIDSKGGGAQLAALYDEIPAEIKKIWNMKPRFSDYHATSPGNTGTEFP